MTQTADLHRQIMGLAFSPAWLNDPDLAIPALEKTRDGGFGTILGFVRHMHHTVTHEHVRRAVRRMAENCHALGLKFALDMDWAHWVNEYVELYPEMAQWTAVRGEAPCFDGRFELNLPYQGGSQVAEISAAYGVTGNGERVPLDVAALGLTRRSYNSQYALPSFDDDHAYDYHRPGLGAHYTLGLNEPMAVGDPAARPGWLVGVDPWNRAELAPWLGESPWDGLELRHHGRAHLRVLRTPQGGGHAILLAAGMAETLNDIVTLGGETVTLNQGAWAAIRVRAGKLEPPVVSLA